MPFTLTQENLLRERSAEEQEFIKVKKEEVPTPVRISGSMIVLAGALFFKYSSPNLTSSSPSPQSYYNPCKTYLSRCIK